jgi:hypothetical protein
MIEILDFLGGVCESIDDLRGAWEVFRKFFRTPDSSPGGRRLP